MSTQNNNYQWRPNDNSVTTNLRYDLEMNHWLKSLRSSTNSTVGDFNSTFQVIGLIFSFLINLIFLILIGLSNLLVWIINKIKSDKPIVNDLVNDTPLNNKKLLKMWGSRIIDDDNI